MPLGPLRYAEIRYSSTVDPINDLFARVAYPEGNQCPVTVLMHGLPGGAGSFDQAALLRIAGYGLFVVAVGMRGRDGASGSPDLSKRELQDILDVLPVVRAQWVEAHPTAAAIVGYSAGGSNALCVVGRHPTVFQVCVDHFGITDYATWWGESPDNQALLNAWTGGTPIDVPAAYASRSPLLNLETFTGSFFFFHDHDDAIVAIHHTTDAITYLEAYGVTPSVSITSSVDPIRWLHALPNNNQPVRFTESIWVPTVLELGMSTHVDRVSQIALDDGSLVGTGNPLPTTAGGGGGSTPNVTVSLLISGTRTVDTPSTDQTNSDFARMAVIVDVSAQSGGIVTPTLQIKDSISNNYVTIWTASVDLTTVGTYAYYFADGANGGSFNETVGFGIPGVAWRLNMVHSNGSGITYSASAQEMK